MKTLQYTALKYTVVLWAGNGTHKTARDVIETDDRAHALQRFRDLTGSPDGTCCTVHERNDSRALASAQWSALDENV